MGQAILLVGNYRLHQPPRRCGHGRSRAALRRNGQHSGLGANDTSRTGSRRLRRNTVIGQMGSRTSRGHVHTRLPAMERQHPGCRAKRCHRIQVRNPRQRIRQTRGMGTGEQPHPRNTTHARHRLTAYRDAPAQSSGTLARCRRSHTGILDTYTQRLRRRRLLRPYSYG